MSPLARVPPRARVLLLDLALFALFGALMAYIGPYGTALVTPAPRIIYWMIAILGGGALGAVLDQALERVLKPPVRRTLLVSALMTPPIAALVWALGLALLPPIARPIPGVLFVLEVAAIVLLVMGVRALARRRPDVRIQTQTLIETPLPEAEAAFRRRLSAKRRTARLIAIEADDHYLKVYTDAGTDLIALRFADALAELERANGVQIHRSWWVAQDAVLEVRWRRGGGDAVLKGGIAAPVSRTHAPKLKALGWR